MTTSSTRRTRDFIAEFAKAAADHGLVIKGAPVADGEIHRCGTIERQGKDDAGAYRLSLFGNHWAVGGYQNWRNGPWIDWRPDKPPRFTEAEKQSWERERQEQAKRVAAERERRAQDGKSRAQALIASASSARDRHPYAAAKGFKPTGLYQQDDALIVPMRDGSGEVWNVQRIWPDGKKRFLSGGRTTGLFFVIGQAESSRPIFCVCEGVATGYTIHQATGLRTVVMFNAGNLEQAIDYVHNDQVRIIVCADDDWKTINANGEPNNAGVKKANELVDALQRKFPKAGHALAVPKFSNVTSLGTGETIGRADSDTDFNDLAAKYGIDFVKKNIEDIIEESRPKTDEEKAAIIDEYLGLDRAAQYDRRAEYAKRCQMPKMIFDELVGERKKFHRQHDQGDPEKARQYNSAGFEVTKEGIPKSTCANTRLALAQMGVECREDVFNHRAEVKHKAINGDDKWHPLDDRVWHRLREEIHDTFNFETGRMNAADAVYETAIKNRYHPVKAYLEGLKWDGVSRIETWLITYLGAPDTLFVRAVGRIALLAGIARIYEPGFKFDQIIVLEGEQGIGKSTAIKILAVRDEWFSDQSILGNSDQTQQELLSGKWHYEIAELFGLRSTQIGKINAFLSRQVDRARPAYGKITEERPRTCIIWATTNDNVYLLEGAAHRRVWPIKVGGPKGDQKLDLDSLKGDIHQLWAEAYDQFVNLGEKPELPRELYAVAREEQEQRIEEDIWHVKVQEWTESTTLIDFTLMDVAQGALNLDAGRCDKPVRDRIAAILRQLGFEDFQKRPNRAVRRWRKLSP
jgi:predicted P-loop ATPase/phage/plasmid primase-like uncharacterized protein